MNHLAATFDRLLDEVGRLHAAGDHVAAQTALDTARRFAQRELPDRVVDVEILRGRAHRDVGATVAAEHAFRQAIELVDDDATDDVVRKRLIAHRALAALFRVDGRYVDAAGHLRTAIAFCRTRFGSSSEIVPLLNELGVTGKYSGAHAEAEAAYAEALAILERMHDSDHAAIATLYHNLGGIAHARGDFARAEPFARRAVSIRERLLGSDHRDVAADRAALAPILAGLGRSDEAEHILRQVLRVYLDDGDDYETAITLHNLGAIAFSRRSHDSALRHFADALALKERILGPNHPELASTLSNLGVTHIECGDLAAARRCLERTEAILLNAVNADHPTLRACQARLAALDSTTE